MFRFRTTAKLSIAAVASFALSSSVAHLEPSVPFNTQGFPLQWTPTKTGSAKPLTLSSVGMRRKSLFIVEVDVYWVGLSLSTASLQRVKSAVKSNTPIADAILYGSETVNQPVASTTLKFVRAVTTPQIVEAFNEAFVGCRPEDIAAFKKVLGECVGTNGMKIGEEINFIWTSHGGLVVSSNTSIGAEVHSKELEKRLLEVYVDKARTVSPDLVKCISTHIADVHEN